MSTNAEFVEAFAAKLGTNERLARKALRAFVKAMQEVMSPGTVVVSPWLMIVHDPAEPKRLEIRGLGTFYRACRPKRRQLHPITREPVFTKPQVVVAFRAGKAMRKVMP